MSQSSASSRVGKRLSVAARVRAAISEAKTAGLDIQKIEISTDGVASIIAGNSSAEESAFDQWKAAQRARLRL